MNGTKPQPSWTNFLKYFSETNRNRQTRIGLFEKLSDVTTDYWLENGLPLLGIDLDIENDTTVVQIMLERYTHVVRGVRTIRPIYSFDGTEDGIDFIGPDETTTILRFES